MPTEAYNARMDGKRIVLAVIAPIVAVAMVVGAPVQAAPRCEANVHAELTHVERKELVTTHTFSVEVATQESCATVHFTLYTTERISKKKTKVFKTGDEIRLRDGTASRVLNYDMPNGREMVRWDVKLTDCERCQP